jgi:soluble lytic murein transglycosylase
MLTTLTLALAVTVADPRPVLVELQLAGQPREALALVDRELAEHASLARRMGLDYLRGHLLDLLGDPAAASEAFGAAMGAAPSLAFHARYRMALDQERMQHPEVAAGLVASVVAAQPSPPLLGDSVQLLVRTLEHGGDCRLLRGLSPERFPITERRVLLLAEGDCALRGGLRELARNLYVRLLQEGQEDDPGRIAAERLAGLVSEEESGRTPMLLGLAFHRHRELERALRHLQMALVGRGGLSARETLETRYAQARSLLWQERYSPAALLFGEIAESASTPVERARALFQQGRSYELPGHWALASKSFRLAYLSDPRGEWAAPSLLAALRLDWRSGREADAAALYEPLLGRREWRDSAFRAALFLASSDIERGRRGRVRSWLNQAVPETPDDRLELAYWRGRLAELDKNGSAAVSAYLDAIRLDLWHPLSQAALRRLAAPSLARNAETEGRRLAAASDPASLYGAWILLRSQGSSDPAGLAARRRLRQLLLGDRTTKPFLRLYQVPVESWPIWKATLTRPEEMLLALGLWREGAPAIHVHFPVSEPALAYTGSLLLARSGEYESSILHAEALRQRLPPRLPLEMVSRSFRQLLYPLPYQGAIVVQGRLRGVDPDLLAAVIREESRFDRLALSPAAARGLTQLTLPTALRMAAQIDAGRISPEDLYRPEVSAALGAAFLGILLKSFRGTDFLAVAAYNAGEPQARLWRSYSYSPEMEELFSKIGFRDTRSYLRRVLTSRAHYSELY